MLTGRAVGSQRRITGRSASSGKSSAERDTIDRFTQVQIGEVHLRAPLVLDRDRRDTPSRVLERTPRTPDRAVDDLLDPLRDQAFEILGGDVRIGGQDR